MIALVDRHREEDGKPRLTDVQKAVIRSR